MKRRRIILSIALALSIVLVALMSSDSKAQAQNQMNIVADTGVITLGPNQTLRLAAGFDPGPLDGKFISFRQTEYTQGICNSGVCKHTIASQNTSNPIMLLPGEAASIDITPTPNSSGIRLVVLSNNQNAKVNASIIDTVTGNVVSLIDCEGFAYL